MCTTICAAQHSVTVCDVPRRTCSDTRATYRQLPVGAQLKMCHVSQVRCVCTGNKELLVFHQTPGIHIMPCPCVAHVSSAAHSRLVQHTNRSPPHTPPHPHSQVYHMGVAPPTQNT